MRHGELGLRVFGEILILVKLGCRCVRWGRELKRSDGEQLSRGLVKLVAQSRGLRMRL